MNYNCISNTDECHRCTNEQKNPNTEEHILHDSVYIQEENRQAVAVQAEKRAELGARTGENWDVKGEADQSQVSGLCTPRE